MQSYDEIIDDYLKQLEQQLMQFREEHERISSELVSLRHQLSDAHRQIAVLEDQLRHYYL